MAERQSSNVLRFEPPDSASSAPQLSTDASRLLAGCRDRLIHGTATSFAENMGRAVEDLLGMADRATSLDQQQAYFAAMELLERRGQELLQQFRGAYVNQFDAGLSTLRRTHRPEQQYDAGELSLVDTEDFERDLAISKLSARAACNCAHQLTALDRRLAALLRVPRISHDENPFYPRALFGAMLQAFASMRIGQRIGLILLQEMERQTSVELPAIYADLNRHLIDSGVLPKIPLSISRAPQRAAQTEPLEDFGAGGGDDDRIALEPDRPERPGRAATPVPDEPVAADSGAGALSADQVFGQLLRAIQAAASGPVGHQGLPAHTQHQIAQPALQQGSAGSALDVTDLVEALTSIQLGRADARYAPVLGPRAIDPTQSDALRQIRETPLANWSHPVDAFTIDIVAMLFDAIYNDPELPVALRAEIAKLQIPVLKVALIDKTFFSNKRHPARRLLDVIATAAVGRSEEDEKRVVSKISVIINTVVDGFDTDIDVFSSQVEKLEEFLEDEESRAETRATAVVEKLREADREELAVARAGTEISSRIHRRYVPALVADFLDQHWRKVLVRASVRAGDDSAPWKAAVGAMDDLLWSVEPKHGSEDRDRLLTTLPDLLRRLRTGLEESGLNEAWDPFFAQLIRLHVGALHKDIPQEEYRSPSADQAHAAPEAQGEEDRQKQAQLEDDADDEARMLALDYDERSAPKSAAGAMPSASPASAQPQDSNTGSNADDAYLERAQSLQIGAWVEFQSFRGTRKALRLNWVSEFRGVMLFTNRQGENALTLAATSLAQHLRKRTARILSPDRLTDRAVAKLLAKSEPEVGVEPQ